MAKIHFVVNVVVIVVIVVVVVVIVVTVGGSRPDFNNVLTKTFYGLKTLEIVCLGEVSRHAIWQLFEDPYLFFHLCQGGREVSNTIF